MKHIQTSVRHPSLSARGPSTPEWQAGDACGKFRAQIFRVAFPRSSEICGDSDLCLKTTFCGDLRKTATCSKMSRNSL